MPRYEGFVRGRLGAFPELSIPRLLREIRALGYPTPPSAFHDEVLPVASGMRLNRFWLVMEELVDRLCGSRPSAVSVLIEHDYAPRCYFVIEVLKGASI
jgi:hypothetical protein